eukprot:TRINITY_DN50225_c0_g1_i1.p1 TRINITY_DN50225_c0_g1~~TRINITY_DN50225_c0_g1_i1.p1  ORF type:complete len:1239 (+),score=214.23 TRINITY_DN50225_c0_g1_i1:69-3785(+)
MKPLSRPRRRQPHWPAAALLLLCVQAETQTGGTLTTEEQQVSSWAQGVGREINITFEAALGFSKIQREYMASPWTGQARSGAATLSDLLGDLGGVFQEVRDHLLRMRDAAVAAEQQGGAQVDSYWDADGLYNAGLEEIRARGELNAVTDWDTRYKWNVNWKESSVKIPTDLPRNFQGAADCVRWSEALERWWVSNTDPEFRKKTLYQFFGCAEGPFRIYPGRTWSRSHSGVPRWYDAHTRPWYTAGQSGPKDIAIVLDTSASMSGWRGRMSKAIAANILDSLSQDDYFTVIHSGQSAQDYWEDWRWRPDSEVLGCFKDRLAAATPSHKDQVRRAMMSLKPYLGTRHGPAMEKAFAMLARQRSNPKRANCQQVVVLITDNGWHDPGRYTGAYCGDGYYDDDGHWNPPPLCDYRGCSADMEQCHVNDEVRDVVRRALQGGGYTGTLFAFSVDSGGTGAATGAFCFGKGHQTFLEPHEHIGPSHARLFTQTLHEYMAQASRNNDPVWSAPYADSTTGSLLVSMSVPIYRAAGSLAGVAGLDVMLSDIVDRIQARLWGTTYAFVLNKRGEAIVHPRNKPLREVTDGVQFPTVEDLETVPVYNETTRNMDASPAEFLNVVASMLAGQSGVAEFRAPSFWRRGSEAEGYSVLWERKRYSWGHIPGSDFSLCVVERIGLDEKEYDTPRDSPVRDVSQRQALYHRLGLLQESTLQQRGAQPSSLRSDSEGRWFASDSTTFQLSYRCFCDVNGYMREGYMNTTGAERIDAQVNSQATPPSCSAAGDHIHRLRPECVHDLRAALASGMSSASSPVGWAESQAAHQGQVGWVSRVAWRYMGTRRGSVITYPGVQTIKSYQATERPWYYRPAGMPRLIAITRLYEDLWGKGLVISLAKAVMAGPDNHWTDAGGTPRSCTADSDCDLPPAGPSAFAGAAGIWHSTCVDGRCSSRVVAAVAAFDLGVDAWQGLIDGIVRTGDSPCGERYRCTADGGTHDCETRCYILDASAHVVWNSSQAWPEHGRDNSPPLGESEGELVRQLTFDHGVYSRSSETQYQGVCDHSSGWIEDYWDTRRLAADWDNTRDMELRRQGPFPPHSSRYMCVKDVSFFSLNSARIRQPVRGQMSGPCSYGSWEAAAVPGAALVLVRVRNWYNVQAALFSDSTGRAAPPFPHLGCRAANKGMTAGAVPVTNLTCTLRHQEQLEEAKKPSEQCTVGTSPPLECVDRGGAAALGGTLAALPAAVLCIVSLH